MQTAELSWMAGLLEGEGCFSLSRNTPAVIVAMTDEDIVQRVCNKWGSNLRGPQRRKGSRKDVWVTSIHGGAAVGWMLTLYSLLGRRRQTRVREILNVWRRTPVGQRHRTHCSKGHEYSATNTRYYHGRRNCRACARDHMRTLRATNNHAKQLA